MKKGYMFMLDVAIAIVILLLAASLFFFKFFHADKTLYFTEQLSHDVVGVLGSTKIGDLCMGTETASCQCPNYKKIEAIVCSGAIKDYNANLLSMISETIEKKSADQQQIKDMVHEIFVDKKVIDEKRFGFSLIYTDPLTGAPAELYNSDKYP